ncbi:MAG: zinc ribbon domain-containing protein, partial [Oscillospiraceae bacterium]|nr:zinc ribbon domain-containing protein [Oscillospiraceae bacterium]
MNEETKPCPHCGAQLPVGASFCPHCAQDISQRREVSPPRHMPRWALYSALMVLAALLLAGGLYLRSRPQVYDNGAAEVLYTDGGVTYQVLAGWI